MINITPCLYIFSGRPGAGKSTLSKLLATQKKAVYLRIDTIEQGLRDLYSVNVEGEGYRLTYRVATDNLSIGNNVIADSCNPIELTRDEWEQVATNAGCRFMNIEILCSDAIEHQHRIETRDNDISNLLRPDWKNIQSRQFDVWSRDRIRVDTAGQSTEQAFSELLKKIQTIEEKR